MTKRLGYIPLGCTEWCKPGTFFCLGLGARDGRVTTLDLNSSSLTAPPVPGTQAAPGARAAAAARPDLGRGLPHGDSTSKRDLRTAARAVLALGGQAAGTRLALAGAARSARSAAST
jgi:hypothetical protein